MEESKADYTIIFDGGSIGNPGRGYGSYALMRSRGVQLNAPTGTILARLEFGDGVTNNEAEYLSLIAGLKGLLVVVERQGLDASSLSVEVRGDSLLVINHLRGLWKVRNRRLQPLWAEAKALLERFGQAKLQWQSRVESVAILGH